MEFKKIRTDLWLHVEPLTLTLLACLEHRDKETLIDVNGTLLESILLKIANLFGISCLALEVTSFFDAAVLLESIEFFEYKPNVSYGGLKLRRTGCWFDYARKNAIDYIERCAELCYVVVGKQIDYLECRRLYERVLLLQMFERLSDCVKYWTNEIWCDVYHTQERPKKNVLSPSMAVLPKPLLKWIQLKKGANNRYRKEVREGFLTIFMGFKKALLPLSPRKILKAAEEHALTLGKEAPKLPEEMIEDVARKTERILRDWHGTQIRKCQTESASAAFDVTRREGGSTRFLMDMYDQLLGRTGPKTRDFVGFASTWREGKGPGVRAVYSAYPDYNHMLRLTLGYQPEMKVRPAFILEPLKVRTVTLADALGQRFFSPVQKSLWSFLSKTPQFSLIGRKLEDGDIQFLVDQMGPEDHLLSGDFKAATDNLNSSLSDVVLDVISDKLSRKNNDIFLLDYLSRVKPMTTSAKIVYEARSMPKVNGVDWRKHIDSTDPKWTVQQKNGQLMGSTVSFLVLCLVNYCLHWRSWEKYLDRTLEYSHVPDCLINGDDYLTVASSKFYDIWQKETAIAGLAKSLGKNFFSRDFCQVNSTTYFVRHNDKYRPSISKTNFVNFGLLHGRGKGMDAEQEQYPIDQDHKRFTKTLDKGTVAITESTSDDFSAQEAPLHRVYSDLKNGLTVHRGKRVDELWSLQMDYLRAQLLSWNINIKLPGDPGWYGCFDELELITSLTNENEDRHQTYFPEFRFRLPEGLDIRKRIKRARLLRKTHYENDDQGVFPAKYFPFRESIMSQLQEETATESRVVFGI